MKKLNEVNVVLIADVIPDHSDISIFSTDLECIENEYFLQVYDAIKHVAGGITFYSSPDQFIDNIHLHKSDVVMSLWSGQGSRNRKALVPAICETYHIRYVGADTYVHSLCSDKYLTKLYCSEFNIQSAQSVLFTQMTQSRSLLTLHPPFVVKPNAEGGSIGISDNNVFYNATDAMMLVKELLPQFSDGILVEEYIPGHEIITTIWGREVDAEIIGQTMLTLNGKAYFDREVYGFEGKKENIVPWEKRDVDILSPDIKSRFLQLYKSLGKVDYMRIDGRQNEKGFYLLELTPDASLYRNGSFYSTCKGVGLSYYEMIEKLLSITINRG